MAPLLTDVLGIPTGVFLAIGAFLVMYAAGGWAIRTPRRISKALSWCAVVASFAELQITALRHHSPA